MAIPTLSWLQQLLPGSFRGIPFVTERSGFQTNQRYAVHEYPFKDIPIAEPLGLAPMTFNFTGFLVGDDCYLQRDALAAAVQNKNPGILIHPSLTYIPSAVCLSASFNERVDRGRVVEVDLQFLATDNIPILLPFSLATDFFASSPTLSLVVTAVATVASASKQAFSTIMNPASLAIGLVGSTLQALGGFTSRVISALDPTSIFNSLNGMQVLADQSFTLSRYIPGNSDGSNNPVLSGIPITLSPADRISQATTAVLENTVIQRAALSGIVQTAEALAASDPSGAYLPAIYNVTEGLRAAINEPSDQIRLLSPLASFQYQSPVGTSTATQAIFDGTSSAARKGALMSIALAVGNYQPSDVQDVNDILAWIVPLFDDEILYAADQGDIATYNALIALRATIVTNLQVRGSQLPELVTINEPSNLPSVVVAYQLYQDATRNAEVLQRVDPIHPLFMPLSFQVLSS